MTDLGRGVTGAKPSDGDTRAATSGPSDTTDAPHVAREPLFPLAGCKLTVTVEDGGYIKAYVSPDDSGILSYGLQGRLANEIVRRNVRALVDEYLEAQHG